MKNQFFYSVPAIAQSSPVIRKIAENFLAKTPFSEKTRNRLKLAFSEVFMNAVMHGSSGDSTVDIRFFINDDGIIIQVDDAGKEGFKITPEKLKEKVKFNEENANVTQVSGRGISQIIKNWTDDYSIENSEKGGIKFTFKKFFKNDLNETAKVNLTIEKNKTNTKDLERKVFAFNGEIDESNINQKTIEIDKFIKRKKAVNKLLVLDFNGLSFFISTFIAKIVEWNKSVLETKGGMEIINVSDDVFDILDLVGIAKFISIVRKK